jgi:hypothetical protein
MTITNNHSLSPSSRPKRRNPESLHCAEGIPSQAVWVATAFGLAMMLSQHQPRSRK